MNIPTQLDGPPRYVTARELGRGASQLLDEIERERCALVVTRFGRPAAIVLPFGDGRSALTTRRNPEPQAAAAPDEDEVEITPIQATILDEVASRAPRPWIPSDPIGGFAEFAKALLDLQSEGLIAEGRTIGYEITSRGWRRARPPG
jgi:hypothetical protein